MICFRWNSRDYRNPNILRSYLQKCSETKYEIWTWGLARSCLKWLFLLLKCRQKLVVEKIPRWPLWTSETLESKALIPNVMKQDYRKIKNIDECLEFSLFEGATSFTLHKWTILGWYKWQDLLSIYRSLRDHNIIKADITIIM